ncbi:MAG: IS21 family transposase ISAzo12 [Syntrophus sp. SKADARSKE-3]|nr:IS21 family transposase ISAzo12 [Syntrophus sp. SKADARSKE-3]MDQ5988425.1 IS21 family transposase ISAzo12 [Syntrophus sp. SKADARSKE-3]
MMNPMPELIPMLKQLRLSGIMDSIESRNRQAIAGKFSYMDFLATVIQDEVARRAQKRLVTAVRRANFRNQKTLEEFDFSFNPNINRALITELASCRFMEEKVAALIVGPCGTGKSHIAQALGHCAIRKGYDVLFTNASRMLAQLHAARATNSYERQLVKLVGVDLLIIDDFGLKPLTGMQDEDFHEVISERYERKSTIVTSNLDVPEWPDAFPNRILGAATIDRLRHGAYKIILDGKSYRSATTETKTQKTGCQRAEKQTSKGGEIA